MPRIMRLTLVFAVCVLCNAPLHARQDPAAACERLEQQRDRVYQQMRRSHGAARGNQLRARLRELNSRIAQSCR